jgi:hypothetical protein
MQKRKKKELLQINHQSWKAFKISFLVKAWRILASLRDHGTIRLRKEKHKVNLKKTYIICNICFEVLCTHNWFGVKGHGTI